MSERRPNAEGVASGVESTLHLGQIQLRIIRGTTKKLISKFKDYTLP